MNMKQQTIKQIVRLTREDKALQLFQSGAVSKISDDLYHVKSQSQSQSQSQNQKNEKVEYEVIPSLGVCTCIDFERNGLACKHVMATQIFRMSQMAAILTAAKIQIQTLNKIGVVITRI